MKEIVYTDHLKFRMLIRKYPKDLPEEVFNKASEYFYDDITRHYIAVSRISLGGKIREFAVSFDVGENIKLITIHPLRKKQKDRRIMSGRWKKLEEKEW